MKSLFVVAFLLGAIFPGKYECLIMPPIKSKDDLKPYDFIALATIDSIAPLNTDVNLHEYREIKIHTTELFKGNTTPVIDQRFPDFDAADLEKGEQWLIIGVIKNGRTQIIDCFSYRITGKGQHPAYYGGAEQLDALRHIYHTNK